LIETLADRNSEIETWRTKYVQLEINLQKLNEYEKRHSIMKNENQQFKRALEDKANELDEWISRYGHLHNPINEIEDLKRKLDSKNRELRTLEDKVLALKEDHAREMQKMIHKYTEIDSRAKRMIGQLDEKTEDGLVYKQKYESLVAQMETMKLQLETKFRGRLEDVLQDITTKSDSEKGALENHLQQASVYINDLETKVATIGADNDRLDKMLGDRSRENEGLRMKLAGIEGN